MGSPEENLTLVRRSIEEVLNQKRIEVLDELWAEDVVDHSLGEGQRPGRAGAREIIEWMYEHRPELHVSVDAAIADGDLVATRETWTTNNMIRQVYHWVRIRDGQVVEEWSGSNTIWQAEDAKPAD